MKSLWLCAEDLDLEDGDPVIVWRPRLVDGISDMLAFDAMLHPPAPKVAFHPSSRTGRNLRSARKWIKRWQDGDDHIFTSAS